MSAGQIKFLVTLSVLLVVWRLFEIPALASAFWAFCTVGAIPGTTYQLGSDMMLRILCITFAVTFFLIFRKEFMASLPRRQTANDVANSPKPSKPRPTQRDETILTLYTHKDSLRPGPRRPLLLGIAIAVAWAFHSVSRVEAACQRLVATLMPQLQKSFSSVARYVATLAQWAWRILCKTGRFVVRFIVLCWKHAEPYIRAFDQWLDETLHANQRSAEVLHFFSDASKVLSVFSQKVRRVTRELLQDK